MQLVATAGDGKGRQWSPGCALQVTEKKRRKKKEEEEEEEKKQRKRNEMKKKEKWRKNPRKFWKLFWS